jgi:lipopolysaccharide/colanic/teichoic acid biosynthesis glycosyltransferase
VTLIGASFWIAEKIHAEMVSDFEGVLNDWPWNLARMFVFWIAVYLQDFTWTRSWFSVFSLQFYTGLGLNLIFQACLASLLPVGHDVSLVALECGVASALLTGAHFLLSERAQKAGVLLVGDRPLPAEIVVRLDHPILGSVGSVVPGIAHLGELEEFEAVVSRSLVKQVVISASNDFPVSRTALLHLRLRGVEVENATAIQERLLYRVSSEGLQPTSVVLSPALRASSRIMAIQAVYTNLIGLIFLFALMPLMVLVALWIMVTGPGPVFQSVDCAGFQKIPFRRLRFRVRRGDGSGSYTMAGRMLSRSHLADLPQLINIVRGEMALFGPAPVRCVFANRLTQLIPFYGHRFSVKPGILGWAQIHEERGEPTNELRRLEYDLYYIKEGSPVLDLKILIRSLTGGAGSRSRTSGTAAQPGIQKVNDR